MPYIRALSMFTTQDSVKLSLKTINNRKGKKYNVGDSAEMSAL
jgi:hypothetical protein